VKKITQKVDGGSINREKLHHVKKFHKNATLMLWNAYKSCWYRVPDSSS